MKTSPRRGLLTSAASLLIALSLNVASHAQAISASITWGPATGILGNSDVVNTGAVVGAFNLGTTGVPSTIVNGVTFAPFAIPADFGPGSTTVGGVAPGTTFTLGFDGRFADNTGFGSASPPFSSLTPAYRTLLQSAAVDGQFDAITLTMSGLTFGQAYVFQWWSNDSGPFLGNPQQTTATSGNAVTLNDNPTATPGALGQYAIGTFTADNPNQQIIFTGAPSSPVINAFQLQTVVPEPTSAVLLLGSELMLLLRRRRAAAL